MAIAPTLVIDVIDPTGQSHRVVGRAAEMVAAIIRRGEQINGANAGQLVFDFGPGNLAPSFREYWERWK